MERDRQLAEAAITGHWPPHLLAPDEDKVYVLGQALRNILERYEELLDTPLPIDVKSALESL